MLYILNYNYYKRGAYKYLINYNDIILFYLKNNDFKYGNYIYDIYFIIDYFLLFAIYLEIYQT